MMAPERRFIGEKSIVGAGVPVAGGVAMATVATGNGKVVVVCIGDPLVACPSSLLCEQWLVRTNTDFTHVQSGKDCPKRATGQPVRRAPRKIRIEGSGRTR